MGPQLGTNVKIGGAWFKLVSFPQKMLLLTHFQILLFDCPLTFFLTNERGTFSHDLFP